MNQSVDESQSKSLFGTEQTIYDFKEISKEILNSSYEVGYSISKMKSLKNKILRLEAVEN